eukprot:XP_001703221.1 predicted protein [Chlamydomonas reinhardtii]
MWDVLQDGMRMGEQRQDGTPSQEDPRPVTPAVWHRYPLPHNMDTSPHKPSTNYKVAGLLYALLHRVLYRTALGKSNLHSRSSSFDSPAFMAEHSADATCTYE